jgi:membrane associated rhomboid family serine protease
VFPIRDSQPGLTRPVVTIALVLVNVAVWVLFQLPDLDGSIRDAAYFPCALEGSCVSPGITWPLTVVTSMFMHGSWLHLIGNLLFLWIFGNNVEDAMGHVRYLVFYVLAGVAATLAQTLVTLAASSDASAAIPNVGASGAIAGVMGAYILLYPHARITTLIGIIPVQVRAIWYLGFWFLFQLWTGSFSVMKPEEGGGVAFFAHVGGFVFGLVGVLLFARRRPAPARGW